MHLGIIILNYLPTIPSSVIMRTYVLSHIYIAVVEPLMIGEDICNHNKSCPMRFSITEIKNNKILQKKNI